MEPCPQVYIGNPTHTEQNLHWDSHHHIAGKCVINTLAYRVKAVCFTPELLRTEKLSKGGPY